MLVRRACGQWCVFHSKGSWVTTGGTESVKMGLILKASSSIEHLLSVDTVLSALKQLFQAILLQPWKVSKIYSHFKDKNTETQPGLRNWLKVMWLISGSTRTSPHTSGLYILPTTSLPAAPAPPFITSSFGLD